MKQILMIFAAFLLGAAPVADTKKDSDGHVLAKLWESFRAASGADRPKEQAGILEQIKKEASAKKLPWDWYDAARRYVDVRSSSNWKMRDSLSRDFAAEADAFGEPVVGLALRMDTKSTFDVALYARDHRDKLGKSRNPEFWARLLRASKFTDVLPGFLESDYDFALWHLFLREAVGVDGDLSARVRGNYPLEAFYDYQKIVRSAEEGRKARLEAFAEKYSGKAAALLAREDLLQMRFSELAGSGASPEADYLALRDECRSLQKEASSYRGTEKEISSCCRQAGDILAVLEAPSIEASVEGRKLAVRVRNIKKVKVSLGKEGGKELFGTSLANPGQRFYVPDSLGCELPVLDDGEYSIVCSSGNERAEIRYERHSLSLAVREISSGIGVYVTDYVTGEPLKEADIILLDANGKDLVVRKGLRLKDGFTPLGKEFSSRMGGNKWQYRFRAEATGADGHRRASRQDTPGYITKAGEDKQVLHALILTDRGAYNPGDELFFKAIAYEGTYKWKTVAAGKDLSVSLVDTQGKLISEKKLSCDAFGAVYGSFVLERSSRNGRYTVYVSDGKTRLAGCGVRVDDFVLPSFDLKFDESDGLILPGDEIKVSGRVTAYSGHNLSSARAEWSVSGTEGPASGELELLPDGSFSFSFKASERSWAHYDIAVKVADGTGETREFRTWRSSREGVDLYLDLVNETEGHFSLPSRDKEAATSILSDPQASVRISSSPHPSLEIGWTLENGAGKVLEEGKMKEGAKLSLDLGGQPDGMYLLKARASVKTLAGKELKADRELAILKVSDGSRSIDADVRGLFKVPFSDALAVQVGHTGGPVWGVAEVLGSGDVLLASGTFRLSGERGREGSLETVSFEHRPDWPDAVCLKLLYFRDGEVYTWSRTVKREKKDYDLPLEFTRWRDSAAPGASCRFELKTLPGVQLAMSAFDKASETMQSNFWIPMRPYVPDDITVNYSCAPGFVGSRPVYMVRGLGAANMMFKAAAAAPDEAMYFVAVEESVLNLEDRQAGSAFDAAEAEVRIRTDLSTTLAWEPALESDASGKVAFDVKAGDKLSTFNVQVFAHDAKMRNASLRRELVVTVPVKVSLTEPQFLYSGDKYVIRSMLMNGSAEKVDGTARVLLFDGKEYDGKTPLQVFEKEISVPAGDALPFVCTFEVPRIRDLGILVMFKSSGEDGSDALFVTVPVLRPEQELTEAHSALLKAGSDREALIASLRGSFVNFNGAAASVKEISILDMVKEALPSKVEVACENVVSLSDALYAGLLARSVGAGCEFNAEDMAAKILACRCSDGGFSWFAGMRSSPVLTAVLLGRLASMRNRGLAVPPALFEAVPAAVSYLDSSMFGSGDHPFWRGFLSEEQYMHVRSLYADVPFKPAGADRARLKAFRKDAKAYLVPGKVRGMNGMILAKARRTVTLKALLASDDCKALARQWGVRLAAGSRMTKSLRKDLQSLVEYAEEHRSGGWYFPNAVLPWRGLLESECYAHSLICDLLSDASDIPGAAGIAEGVRLWLMVQKETQQWGSDPAYVEALASVLAGSAETLSTKVVILTASGTLPLSSVRPAGNGFKVSREFFRESSDGARTPLADGEHLAVGEKVVAVYSLYSEENRSFVRLSAPRTAGLRPVQQLSGHAGWNVWRSVLKERTEYWYDVFPEERSRVEEAFFVTAEGEFQAPAMEIESQYAPHYRANGGPVSFR